MKSKAFVFRTGLFVALMMSGNALCQAAVRPSGKTLVVVLGTGTPVADPERSGPAVAIVVNDTAYLVDCGPGVVRRAAAAQQNGFQALDPTKITTVFFT